MKAIFLDRDGVINVYPGYTLYVTAWKNFRFLPRAKKAIALLHRNHFKLFVISNQAGVGKGIYSRKNLDIITRNMHRAIKKSGGLLDEVYYCTHREEENCPCRKPKTGFIKKIVRKYKVGVRDSFFIGDTIRDVETARRAGCRSILVLSGQEKISNQKNWEIQPDFICKDLYAAALFIISRNKKPAP